jgi:NifB/MoaA-like Fe-S oxidoreductase
MSENKEPQFPTYKGKPLVRCGDVIYYGSMKDKYVVRLEIKSKKKVGELEVADKVSVQLMLTDQTVRNRKQIVKTSEKDGLYLAMDIADVWLTRALTEN